jgi:hypothetical protein
MSWRTWLAEKIAPPAKQLEQKADDAIPDHVKGVRIPRARYLLALALLAIFVVGYWRGWHKRFVKPDPSLVAVATQGGEKNPGYAAPPVKKLAGVSRRTTTRPVQSTPVADLPGKEQGYAPVVAPAVGPDNVVRTRPELLTSSVVPPWRGDTEVRTWLNPDGSAQNVLTPQREDFFGWPWSRGNWKRLELEGGYGVGGKQVDAQATWLPLRLGNVHVGARAEGWMEPMGGMKGAGSIRVRWEPFRQYYR